MTTLATVLRGLRSRALLSAASLAIMVLAVSGAVLGPVFQQASTASYTLTLVDQAPDNLTALTWQVQPRRPRTLDALVADAVAEVERVSPAPYGAPQVTLLTRPQPRRSDGALIRYLAREDVCATLEVEGRCPQRPGEVLIHEADLFSLAIGDALDLPGMGSSEIVGVYATPDTSDAYLLPSLLASRPPTQTTPYAPAPFVVTPEAIGGLPPFRWAPQLESRLVVPDRLDDGEFDDLVAATEQLRSATSPIDDGRLLGTSEVNALGSVLTDVRGQREAARSAVTPAVVSLVLIALAMILRLQIATAELRGPELALAALRGVGSRRSWVLGLSEPWLLVLLSAPLGLLAGYAATAVLARAWLRPGLDLSLPTASVVGAVLVAVVLAGVSAMAVRQGMRETLGARLTNLHRPGRSPRTVIIVELVVVLLAAALPLAQLGTDDGGLGLADLLLPVAIAIAAGLLTTRAVAALAIWWTSRAAERPISVFVAARAVARRAQGTLVILPVAAAIAVSVFAVGVDSVAAGWRGSVAATTAPADAVYESPLSLGQTLQLTREVDPQGRWLMTTAQVAVAGAGSVVLVDAPRLGRVAAWSPQWLDSSTSSEVAALVTPPDPLVRIRGERVGLTVASSTAGATVVLGVRTPDGVATVRVGSFAAGSSTRAVRSDLCGSGCDVVAISVEGVQDPVRITDLMVDDAAVSPGLTSARWATETTADGTSPSAPAATEGTDVLVVDPEARLVPGAVAAPLPVIAGVDSAGLLPEGASTALDLRNEVLTVTVVGRAESLPLVGPAGILFDLSSFLARYDPFPVLVTPTVLARGDAPASVIDALTSAGLGRTTGIAETRRALDDSAYAQALRLYLVVAAALLLMALGGLLVSGAVQMPARRRDAASLRVVGVTRRTVVVASLWEFLVVLGTAALAGLAAGAMSLAVLLPSLTLGVVDEVVTPRVLADPDVARLVLFAAVVAGALLVVAVGTSVASVRRARASTLREDAG